MRAITVKDKVFAFSNIPEPSAGPNQVKVRVVAFGVNRTDLQQQQLSSFELSIPGVEFSGHVTEVGAVDAKNLPVFEVGDRVCGFVYMGAWAEYVICDARHLVSLPDGHSMIQAAGMLFSWLSAMDALSFVGGFKQRDKVLLHVSRRSVLGVSLAQYAQTIGCRRVYVVSYSNEDVEFVRKNLQLVGALPDELVAINASKHNWVSIVQKIDPKGVQIVINEGAPQLENDCKVLAPGGSLVYIGPRTEVETNQTTSIKGIRMQSTNLRRKDPKYIATLCELIKERFIDRFANGRLKVHIQRALPWRDIDIAVGATRYGLGKVLCVVNSPGSGQVRLGS